jgi:SAM-dependent methyltransferase
MQQKWDDRYLNEEYVFGKEPNVFFREEILKLVPGNILLVGEGEGRNAVYAALRGWNADAIDFSEEGKRKAEKLAAEYGVKIHYNVVNFTTYQPTEIFYDAIGIIFIHLEEELRIPLFQSLLRALKPGGRIIFECFEKDQINFTSGGPRDESLLYSLTDVINDFIELDFKKLSKEYLELNEGKGHQGNAAVIRFVGIKAE